MTSKEKPILFNAEMVRAILEGRKTQTRRVIKPQPRLCRAFKIPLYVWRQKDWPFECISEMLEIGPYKDAERLWVREAWAVPAALDRYKPSQLPDWQPVLYRADNFIRCDSVEASKDWASDEFGRWRPSIFMPRFASRIMLGISSVRVERAQEIWVWKVEFRVIQKCP